MRHYLCGGQEVDVGGGLTWLAPNHSMQGIRGVRCGEGLSRPVSMLDLMIPACIDWLGDEKTKWALD
jgi:hypothetical protein